MERITGYVYEERYMWHDPGSIGGSEWVEPSEFWENSYTKRRLHNLICVSGLINHLVPIKARAASKLEITRFHTERYHDQIKHDSDLNGGNGGELAPFSKGGYEIASLSAGGVIAATEAILARKVTNAYCLVRPPGHHAEADRGRGFCIFNNIVIAALHARTIEHKTNMYCKRIAIVDYDVHHGNGTQDAFWNDSDCLFISLHQDSNYPTDSGAYEDIGGENAKGTTINIPLPPGSGTGAYTYAFDHIVIPALENFQPDMIFVSSGFDASYADPLACMMLSSAAYKDMAISLIDIANKYCEGRILFAHEGGYSKDYVPFCGIAVIEALSGIKSPVYDHCLPEVMKWGYQECQPHQAGLINKIATLHNISNHQNKRIYEINHNNLDHLKQIQNILNSIEDHEQKQAIINSLSY